MRALRNLWRGFDQDEGREFDEELLFGRNEPSPRSNPRFACSPELGKKKNNEHKKNKRIFQTNQKKNIKGRLVQESRE